MKRLISIIAFCCALASTISAQKIETSFWGVKFGQSIQQVYDGLTAAEHEVIVTDDALFMLDKDVYKVKFQTVGMKFTAEDAFYNLFAYNKVTSKKEAESQYSTALGIIKEQYPTIQQIASPAGCLKLYAYADADTDEAFSLGLYKNDSGVYFVRLNVISNFLIKRAGK